MLEFISVDTVKGLVILFLTILMLMFSIMSGSKSDKYEKSASRGEKIIFNIFVLGLVLMPFVEAYNLQQDVTLNQQHFKSNSSFICKAKDNNDYKVSKKNLWSIDDIYFTKDSLLIRADKCEEIKR